MFVLIRISENAAKAFIVEEGNEIELLIDGLGLALPDRLVYTGVQEQPTEEDCLQHLFEDYLAGLASFPDTVAIASQAAEAAMECMQDFVSLSADDQLLIVTQAEYRLFMTVEEHFLLPEIRSGFESVPPFLKKASSVMQRRKARAGRSLELQLERILRARGLRFDAQPVLEGNDRPDVLFPGRREYLDASVDPAELRVLAVKRTCRDRWRQVTQEAKRISVKHLLTLQPEMSVEQFSQIHEANIRLVVPQSLHRQYPTAVRDELISLESFIKEVSALQQKAARSD